MGYLMDSDFPFGLKDLLLDEDGIKERGLKIIAKIDSETIYVQSEQLKIFYKSIDSQCKDKHLWVLFGRDNSEKWLPLQLASVSAKKDIRSEIKSDFMKMIPFDPKTDTKGWKSKYHGPIMEVEIGKDIYCQKYGKLRDKIKHFAIAILEKEEYGKDSDIITRYQIKELDLADKLKPLIWNPSPLEMKHLNER